MKSNSSQLQHQHHQTMIKNPRGSGVLSSHQSALLGALNQQSASRQSNHSYKTQLSKKGSVSGILPINNNNNNTMNAQNNATRVIQSSTTSNNHAHSQNTQHSNQFSSANNGSQHQQQQHVIPIPFTALNKNSHHMITSSGVNPSQAQLQQQVSLHGSIHTFQQNTKPLLDKKSSNSSQSTTPISAHQQHYLNQQQTQSKSQMNKNTKQQQNNNQKQQNQGISSPSNKGNSGYMMMMKEQEVDGQYQYNQHPLQPSLILLQPHHFTQHSQQQQQPPQQSKHQMNKTHSNKAALIQEQAQMRATTTHNHQLSSCSQQSYTPNSIPKESSTTTIDLSNEVVQLFGQEGNLVEVYQQQSQYNQVNKDQQFLSFDATSNAQRLLQQQSDQKASNRGLHNAELIKKFGYSQPNPGKQSSSGVARISHTSEFQVQSIQKKPFGYQAAASPINNMQVKSGKMSDFKGNIGSSNNQHYLTQDNVMNYQQHIMLSESNGFIIGSPQQSLMVGESSRTPQNYNNQDFNNAGSFQFIAGQGEERKNQMQSNQVSGQQSYRHQQHAMSPQPKKMQTSSKDYQGQNVISNTQFHSKTVSYQNQSVNPYQNEMQSQTIPRQYDHRNSNHSLAINNSQSQSQLLKTHHQQNNPQRNPSMTSNNMQQKNTTQGQEIVLQYHIKSSVGNNAPNKPQPGSSTSTQRNQSERKRATNGLSQKQQQIMHINQQLNQRQSNNIDFNDRQVQLQPVGVIQDERLQRLQKFTASAPSNQKGNLTGRQEIIGREITVQSFRDKDNLANQTYCENPFEVADNQKQLLSSHLSGGDQSSSFFNSMKQNPSNSFQIAQKLSRDAPKMTMNAAQLSSSKKYPNSILMNNNPQNSSLLHHSRQLQSKFSLENTHSNNTLRSNHQQQLLVAQRMANNLFGNITSNPNDIDDHLSGHHSKTMQYKGMGYEKERQIFNELRGDENQNEGIDEEENGGDTLREGSLNVGFSGRRPAKSVERTARGAPLPEQSNHYEEYGVKSHNQSYINGKQSLVQDPQNALSNNRRTPAHHHHNHHALSVNRGQMSQGRLMIYNTQNDAQQINKHNENDELQVILTEAQNNLPTMRRGVSQVVGSFQQNGRSSQIMTGFEPVSSFVVIDSKTKPNQTQDQVLQPKDDTSPFSITNLKNSLFSKISNIFQKEEQKAEAVSPEAQPQKQQEIFEIPKEPKYQCNCGQHPKTPYLCIQSFNWFAQNNTRARQFGTITPEEYQKLKSKYKDILRQREKLRVTEEDMKQREKMKETDNQIGRDLLRTFPLHEYYQEGSKGVEKMRRVLTAFSEYDCQVDYVQGMNFIVGSLLYHANEVMTFWLFVSLIEDCELRDIYMTGLPGLFKHSHIISSLVTTNLTDLAMHFAEHNLRVEMYASDWIFGLFASVIPLEQMGAFFSKFYVHKWIFFYQLILSILKFLEKELLQEDELWNILNQIKSQTFHNQAAIGSTGMSPGSKKYKKVMRLQQQDKSNSMNNNNVSSVTPTSAAATGLNNGSSSDFEFIVSNHQNSDSNYFPDNSQQPISTSQSAREDGKVVSLLKRIFLGMRISSNNNQEEDDDEISQFWPILIEKCTKEWRDQIDEQEINRMLKNFDPDNAKWFNTHTNNTNTLQIHHTH